MRNYLVCLCSVLMPLGIAASVPSAAAPQFVRSRSADASWDNGISPSWPGVDGYVGATTAASVDAIAAWDDRSWSALGSGLRAVDSTPISVDALAVFDSRLIAAGNFQFAGDTPAASIAAWDGSGWSSLGSGFPRSHVRALAVFDGELIAGGDFTGNLAAWNGRSWATVEGGASATVSALTTYDDHLIVGGNEPSNIDCFPEVPFCPAWYARATSWDGAAWSPLGSEVNGSVGSFTTYDDHLIMLTFVGGVHAWDGNTWSSFSGSLVSGGMTTHDGSLLVGTFSYSCPWACFFSFEIDAWDGSSWSAFETDVDGPVSALTVYDGQVIAGGSFTTIGGVAANHIAGWDGRRWSPLGSGTDGPVTRLAVYNGSLIVAGDFHRAGGKPSQSIAVWRKPPRPVPQVGTALEPPREVGAVHQRIRRVPPPGLEPGTNGL